MRTAGVDYSGGAPLPSYLQAPKAPASTLPAGVTQQMVDASLAANPNASKGGYEGSTPLFPMDGSSITTGGDPNSWLKSDAGYQALLSSLHGNEDAFGQTMRSQIQRDALQSGYHIPQLDQFLDAGMADQMAADPNSTAAVAAQNHATNLRNIQNQLAARGAYNSGELTYGIGNEAQRYDREGLANRGALLDQINALLGQQATMKGNDSAQLATELGNAAGRQATLHPVGTANYDSSTGSYVDTYGNHYNADGSSFTPGGGGGSTTPPPPSTPAPSTLQTGAQALASGGPYSWGIAGKI